MIRGTLVALPTDASRIVLLVRRDADLLDLVTIGARVITATVCSSAIRCCDVMDLLRCVTGRCRTALLLSLHARHIHDIIDNLLLVT